MINSIFYHHNHHQLTPWCRIFFDKLTVSQPVKKKYTASYGTSKFITVLTTACHYTLPWASLFVLLLLLLSSSLVIVVVTVIIHDIIIDIMILWTWLWTFISHTSSKFLDQLSSVHEDLCLQVSYSLTN